MATSSCRGHVDELATEPFLLLHREHGTGYQRSWNCCDWRTCFVVIWKHFCFILSTGTKIRIDCVMRPRSYSRGHNTSASVTVTVTVNSLLFEDYLVESMTVVVTQSHMLNMQAAWWLAPESSCSSHRYWNGPRTSHCRAAGQDVQLRYRLIFQPV